MGAHNSGMKSDGMTTVFSSSNFNAEVEAETIVTLLRANDVDAMVKGMDPLPGTHEIEVQVPDAQGAQAAQLIAEAQAAGPAAAEEAERESEERVQ